MDTPTLSPDGIPVITLVRFEEHCWICGNPVTAQTTDTFPTGDRKCTTCAEKNRQARLDAIAGLPMANAARPRQHQFRTRFHP